ncbi:hypothetical protein AKJ09_01138 [Labilithrix luteola]|uniref:DUF732 domain-containing protein n=1 Tax=Labilithrix luteola TaxID=1391654 RepID=A0A0K1PMY4_9BACT|nr:hypothetical protein [Labilithrix luteola]AKU94474.1 hypothetical protein AKJ09_01138 [Labilithrix luteola]
MKRIALALIGVAALALSACDGTSDTLTDGRDGVDGQNSGSGSTAGGEDTTFNHSNNPGGADPQATEQPAEPAQIKMVGSPEVTSRLHGCGKLSVASIANLITSRGLTGGQPQGTQSAQQIFNASGAALGAANYNGRVPEAPFASTSAMAKLFDIFAMGSYAAVGNNYNAPACPNTKILGADGKFTKDGLTCLLGKPARDEHVAIANDAIAQNGTDGAKIAIAALLAAAHTCQ